SSVTLVNPFEVDANSEIANVQTHGIPGPAEFSTFTLAGDGTLADGTTLTVVTLGNVIGTAPIIFSGSLSGAGDLTVLGDDTVTLSGTHANSYTGKTTVNVGTLFLNKLANVTAIAGPLVIGDGANHPLSNALVELGADNQIDPMQPITINAFGELKLDNHNQKIGSLSGEGKVVTGDPPLLSVGYNNLSTTFDGVISGPGTVEKAGTGTWTLTGDNTYTGGTIIDDGTLLVDGVIGAVTVNP